jgi:hypothetical protein
VWRAPPKFTAILADAAWRQADAILRNEAKIIGLRASSFIVREPDGAQIY